jgi:hypothetical protein
MVAKMKERPYKVNQKKLDRAKKILGTKTRAETIERALDLVLAEEKINRALDRVGGKGRIEQVF